MNMDFRWIKQRGIYIATAHDTRGVTSMDHHFECDPRIVTDETLWMEWMKLVADHLASNGVDTKTVNTKIQDLQAIYTNEAISDEQEQEQQDSAARGSDDGLGSEPPSGRDSGGPDRGELSDTGNSPPPIAPGWPDGPLSDRPGTAAADAHAD